MPGGETISLGRQPLAGECLAANRWDSRTRARCGMPGPRSNTTTSTDDPAMRAASVIVRSPAPRLYFSAFLEQVADDTRDGVAIEPRG
jgi:hypothetical protein